MDNQSSISETAPLTMSESKYSTALKLAKLGVWELGLDTGILNLSAEHIEMMGYQVGEISDKFFLSDYIERYVHPEDQGKMHRFHHLLHATVTEYIDSFEYKLIDSNSSIIHVLVTIHESHITQNRISGISQNITMQRKTETRLKETLRHLADLKFALDESTLVTITDVNGEIVYANETFCKISGYSREVLIGKKHSFTSSGHHSKQFFKEMWDTISCGKVWRGELKNRNRNGESYWVDTTIVPFLNEHGKPYQYVAIRTDITQRKHVEQKITHMAYHDSLTGLANRRLLNERLTRMLSDRTDLQMPTVILFDLDNFKMINDTLGHQTGDEFLKMVSMRLQELVKPGETLARLGGDEFVLAIPTIDSKYALDSRCSELVNHIKKPFLIQQKEFFVTMSVGAAYAPLHGFEAEELIKNADLAMYCAKHNNKNDYQIFEFHLRNQSLQRWEFNSILRQAIENNEFVLHYQPRIHPSSGIQGLEALIRMQSHDGQLLQPEDFISIAEENGLNTTIGDWVLKAAIKQLRKWLDLGLPPIAIAVNLSKSHFQQDDLVQNLARLLTEYEVEPQFLELEITESLLMHNPEETAVKLKQLKEIGVKISIDNFGTGSSSLYYLSEFPIDLIKMDQKFIQDIDKKPKSRKIIQSIVNLAHELEVCVTAKGVEENSQHLFLNEIGCDFMQGYYYLNPKDVETITELLLNKRDFHLFEDVVNSPFHDSILNKVIEN